MFQRNPQATSMAIVAITAAAVCLVSAGAWADTDSGGLGAESAATSTETVGETSLSYRELEAQIKAYRQYHAEEELLTCLREAKSDPEIRGTHKVGPRLKQLNVQQKLYAELRNNAARLTPQERQSVEQKIVELHLAQKKHIEFVSDLFANGRATTNNALLEYHDTGCIGGLENIVEEIRTSEIATQQPETR